MKNSQMINQFHKGDFLGYAFNFSLKWAWAFSLKQFEISISMGKNDQALHRIY